MDSRGYGRTGTVSARARRGTAGLLVTGMAGLCLGCYGLLDASSPAALGMPTMLTGAVLCCGGLALGGARARRTSYRPDAWHAPEWVVAGLGVGAATLTILARGADAAAMNPAFSPLQWPTLPALPALAVLAAGFAAVAAPPPPGSVTQR
jgi:energy-coupling factor transport system permease protein